MPKKINIVFYIVLVLIITQITNCTHIRGTYKLDEFFKFLIKFGFQKTDRHSEKDSFGYIFGNITSKDTFGVPLTFAVLDKYSFLEYYGNSTVENRELACQNMFERLQISAYDSTCNVIGKGDYLRRIPCRKDSICDDEDTPINVITNSQFTYVISDLIQPRFWYVSIVSCYRNKTTCQWHYYDYNKFNRNNSTTTKNNRVPIIEYDIKLVNGNPNQQQSSITYYNPFTYQFSFDQQNTLEMYLIFFVIYLILVPFQIYAVRLQKHPVTRLFTFSLVLEFVSLCFILIHCVRFAMDGIGNERMAVTGDIFDIFSRTTFMLILLLLAKGWAVTRLQISTSGWILIMAIWIPYCIIHVFLYVWKTTEVDIISDIDEYQTWPGWLVLACRSSMMLWFLWELRNTMKYEHSSKKLDFLLHFGASSLVWFIYLPIVALIALQISPLWRYKLLLGITNSADCLAYCVMTGLLWPNRSGQYLLLTGRYFSGMDELDEFNEAPQNIPRENGGLIEPNMDDSKPSLDILDDNFNINELDEEDEDDIYAVNEIDTLVLSTDDLLVNNSNSNNLIMGDNNLLNGESVTFNRNSHILT